MSIQTTDVVRPLEQEHYHPLRYLAVNDTAILWGSIVGHRAGSDRVEMVVPEDGVSWFVLGAAADAVEAGTNQVVVVKTGLVHLANSSLDPVLSTDIGRVVFLEDNNTVRRGSGGGVYPTAGIFRERVPREPATAGFSWFVDMSANRLLAALSDAGMLATGASATLHRVRGAVGTNVADLAAFTVAGHYGLTFVAGDVVLLLGQTTAAENGPYVVGTVAVGAAPLTRPDWWASDSTQPDGVLFEILEGNTGAGLIFRVNNAGGFLVDTDNPAFVLESAPPEFDAIRGVIDANVADLTAAAVSGAGRDGLTYAEGELTLLVMQTTGTENGPYVFGPVSGVAPLVRPVWWLGGSVQKPGKEFSVNEGTAWLDSKWFATLDGAITVGSSSPAFYPRKQSGTTAAMTAGAINVPNVWLKSTTLSAVIVSYNTFGGTTVGVSAPVAGRTAGVPGTGEFDIAGGGSDTSTVDWCVLN